MLIACQPKSASSAFARGLSNLMQVETIQRQLEPHKTYVLRVLGGGRGKPPGPEVAFQADFPTLSRIHPDTNEIPERLIMRFLLSEATLYKQAIVPISRHIDSLRRFLPYSRGMIVLLRHPDDAVNAYNRHFSHGKGLYDVDPSFFAPAAEDHRKFVRGYITAFGDDPRVKFVCYERLMLDASTVMNECLRFFGFEAIAPPDYRLPKRRFTGLGVERLAGNGAMRGFFAAKGADLRAADLLTAYGLA